MEHTESQRIKIIREYLGLSQYEFSVKLNMKQGSISDIERGKAGVSSKLKEALSKDFYIDKNWIETGGGDMFLPNKQECNNILTYKENINKSLTDSKIDKKYITNSLEVRKEDSTLDTPIPKPKTMILLEETNPNLGDLKIIQRPQKAIPIYLSEFCQIVQGNKIEYLRTENWTSNVIYAGCDAIIRHSGEGMSPVIGDGYLMGIKMVDKDLYFSQGSIYTLVTLSGFKLTKYVWKTKDPDYFRIHGENDRHPEEEIPKTEILSMWHVKVATPSGSPKMFD